MLTTFLFLLAPMGTADLTPAMQAWEQCVTEGVKRYAPLREPSGVTINAAMMGCRAHRSALEDRLTLRGSADTRPFMEGFDRALKARSEKVLLDERLQLLKK